MKRDFELLEKILLAVGNTDDRVGKIEGVSPESFSLHAKLLEDAGLVETSRHTFPEIAVIRLTYKGHDAFEALQESESINWNNLVRCACH